MLDAVSRWPGVLVPGFEPLESRSLSADVKLTYMEAAFELPRDAGAFPAWRSDMQRCGVRQHDWLYAAFEQVESIDIVGFKMRPYVRNNTSHRETVRWSAEAYDWTEEQRAGGHSDMAPGMVGLDPLTVRNLLHRRNVTLVVVTRENSVKEALSWYRAREVGLSQWSPEYRLLGPPGTGLLAGAGGAGRVAAPHGEYQHQPIEVDLDAFWDWLLMVESANRALEEAPAYFHRPVQHILYEDYAKDNAAALRPLTRLFGLPAQPALTSFRKATAGQDLPDLVSNFGALCRRLHGTRFFHHLGVSRCPPPPAPI